MRLAISNIAWAPEDDDAVAAEARAVGAVGVELAPTTVFADPLLATAEERGALRARWQTLGLPVVALQSLLYGQPGLQLFDPATRGALAARLRGILAFAADLGAGALVLGSPKNRTRGALSSAEALKVAVPFFRDLGEAAERLGVCLCIEPNPPQYGCDFVTNSVEGIALVREVGTPGFRLHLDTAGMVLAGERPDEALLGALPWLAHVHLSAPHLGVVGPAAGIDYGAVARALRAGRYRGLVSIEMRASGDGAERVRRVADALRFARTELGGAGG